MRIAVLGAGPIGVTVAGDLSLRGHQVSLWSRSAATLASFMHAAIRLDGALEAEVFPFLVSPDIADVLAGSRLVVVCVPASGHEEVARLAAPFLKRDQVVLLVPGRTFGALAFLRALDCPAEQAPSIAETQTTPFASRRRAENKCHVFAVKKNIATASLVQARRAEVEILLRQVGLDAHVFAANTLVTSMNSIGPLMHCPTMLLNVSLVDANAEWAQKLRSPTKFYSEFITPRVARIIERMDEERMAIAAALGLGGAAESIRQWGSRTYGMDGLSFYEALQTNLSYGPIESPDRMEHRYLTEDVPTGLVPWESLGRSLGVPVPLTSLMIDLADNLLERDFRREGRSLERLGFPDAKALIRELAH
jgi:opine dehydrogenase